jgi:hypothetical protein
MKSRAKEQLVEFLERRAFNPVLRARAGDFAENERETLADVQQRTSTEVERFRRYGSAEEVVTNFKRDLHSKPAQRVHRDLKRLGLPTLNDVQEDFEKLAADLDVK